MTLICPFLWILNEYLYRLYFFLDGFFFSSWAAFKLFFKFKFSFYDSLFGSLFCFFYLQYHQWLSNYKFWLLIQQIFSKFFQLIHPFLIQLYLYFYLTKMVSLILYLTCQTLFQPLLQCLYKNHLFLRE